MVCVHGGAILLNTYGNAKHTVSSSPVITDASIIGAPIDTVTTPCPYAPGGSPSPCLTVDAATGSTIYTVDGAGVIVFGNTTITVVNTDTNSYAVSITAAGQTKLTETT
jgi:hypothetical protein